MTTHKLLALASLGSLLGFSPATAETIWLSPTEMQLLPGSGNVALELVEDGCVVRIQRTVCCQAFGSVVLAVGPAFSGIVLDSLLVCYRSGNVGTSGDASSIVQTQLLQSSLPGSSGAIFTDPTMRGSNLVSECFAVDLPNFAPSGGLVIKFDVQFHSNAPIEFGTIGLKTATPVTAVTTPPVLGETRLIPNPSRHDVRVQLVLNEPGTAEVAILDTAGRRVRSLFRGQLRSGESTLLWDGRDDSGVSVAPGVYFYEVTRGGIREAGRAIRLR